MDELRDRRPDDDASLLAATAGGDSAAFAAFYRRHLSAVLAVLVAETDDRELAADLASEVFAAALLQARDYRPDRETALPWLSAIARNKARDSQRRGRAEQRARRRLGIPREPIEDADLERVDELIAASGVAQLLQKLPEQQRVAVHARVVQERDYAEIAAAAGVSEQTVRQRVSRGLSWLRRQTKGA
jgi:RNA polymerase sigma factor (sigma-70 family)